RSNAFEENCSVFGRSIRENDGKFIAADAANDVFLSQVHAHKLREEFENLIASAMTDIVIDLLEEIQIDERKRQRAPAAARACDFLKEPLVVKPAVGNFR